MAVPYTVRYAWDSGQQTVTRYAGPSSRVVVSNVTAYSWYIDTSGGKPTVVVNLTVTIASYNVTYRELFYPRVAAP